VRGRFPTQAEDALISLAWLEEAKNRDPVDDGSPLKAGVDVAGPGKDETAAVIRCGNSIVAQWASAAPETVAWDECEQFLRQYKPRLDEVNVDYAGLGVGLALQLDRKGYQVNRVNVGEAPRDSSRYFLLKAELYWGLRERFKAGEVNGLTDEKTMSQLATLRYAINARKQVVMETKDAMLKRGVKSPDRAEATMLAFAQMTPGIIDFYRESLEGRAATEEAEREAAAGGENLPEPEDEENDLIAAYERAREEFER